MASLSISNQGKPVETKGIQVRELKADISLEKAIEATQANGMDEAFVEADGKRYVIFSEDNLDLAKASLQVDGKATKVLKLSNEINSLGEGLSTAPKAIYRAGAAAVAPLAKPLRYVAPNPATAFAIAAGVTAGLFARTALQPASITSKASEYGLTVLMGTHVIGTGAYLGSQLAKEQEHIVGKAFSGFLGLAGSAISAAPPVLGLAYMGETSSPTAALGIAIGSIVAVSSVTAAADQSSKSPTARNIRALATGAGSVALGASLPEVFTLLSKIPLPERALDLALKGGKIAGVAALAGGAMATLGLGAAGALKSARPETIDTIAR